MLSPNCPSFQTSDELLFPEGAPQRPHIQENRKFREETNVSARLVCLFYVRQLNSITIQTNWKNKCLVKVKTVSFTPFFCEAPSHIQTHSLFVKLIVSYFREFLKCLISKMLMESPPIPSILWHSNDPTPQLNFIKAPSHPVVPAPQLMAPGACSLPISLYWQPSKCNTDWMGKSHRNPPWVKTVTQKALLPPTSSVNLQTVTLVALLWDIKIIKNWLHWSILDSFICHFVITAIWVKFFFLPAKGSDLGWEELGTMVEGKWHWWWDCCWNTAWNNYYRKPHKSQCLNFKNKNFNK